MSDIRLNIEGDIGIIDELKRLDEELTNLRNESKAFRDETSKAFTGAGEAIDKTNKKIKTSTTATKDNKKEVQELRKKLQELEAAQKSGFDTKPVQKYKKEVSGLDKAVGKVGTAIFAAFGVTTAFRIFGDGIDKIRNFTKAVDELESITGASGDDLKFLEERAIQTSSQVGKSATEIVNAYKLVGSAQPILLKNVEALDQVTQQAIILSQASGDDLASSVQSLTGIMNANSATFEETGRYINVLAAASKEGAAAIPFVADALSKVGPAAAAAGLGIEKQAAAIEVLAEKGIPEASTAGLNFRNILIKLQQDEANFTDGQFDFNKALTNLAPIMNDSVALTKQFGVENVVAAQILIQNVDRVTELEQAITGTNTAYEQAAINTDNLDGALNRTAASYEKLVLSFRGSDGTLKNLTDGFSGLISSLANYVSTNDSWFTSMNRATVEAEGLTGAEAELVFTQLELQDSIEAQTKAWYEYFSVASLVNTVINGTNEGLNKVDVALKRANEQIAQRNLELEKYKEEQSGIISEFVSSKGIDESRKKLLEVEGYLESLQQKFKETGEEQFNPKNVQVQADLLRSAIEQAEAKAIETQKQAARERAQLSEEETKRLKAEAEKRQKLQEDFFNNILKAEQDAEKQRIDLLSGEERIIAERDINARELNELETALNAELAALNLSGDAKIEAEQRIQAALTELRSQNEADSAAKIRDLKIKNAQDELNLNQQIAEEFAESERIAILQSGGTAEEAETAKQRALLSIQLDFAKQRLELLTGTLTDEQQLEKAKLENLIADIRLQSQKLETDVAASSQQGGLIQRLLGLDDDQFSEVQQAASEVLNTVSEAVQQNLNAALQSNESYISALDERIAATQAAIEEEQALRDEGRANNVAGEEAALVELQAKREAALEEQRKLQRRQAAIDALTQISSLATSAAKVFAAESGKGILGVALAISAIATLFSAFGKAKQQAAESVQLEKGGFGDKYGVITGKRHKEGGERFTDHIEVEDGEAFSVFNRKATAKYGDALAGFTAAVNSGDVDKAVQELISGTGIKLKKDAPSVTLAARRKIEFRQENNQMLIAELQSQKKELVNIKHELQEFAKQYIEPESGDLITIKPKRKNPNVTRVKKK